MVTDRFTWIYKCDTVHVIVAWGGVYREKLDHRYKKFPGLETDHVLSLATNNRGALTAE